MGETQPTYAEDIDLPVAGSTPPETVGSVASVDVRDAHDGTMVPEPIGARLDETDLSMLAGDSTISEFWKRQIANAKQRAQAGIGSAPLRLMDVIAELGYGFKPLSPGQEIDEDTSFRTLLDRWERFKPMARRSGAKLPGLSLDEWEHLSAIAWLEQEELLEDYLATIRPFRVKSSMALARHYYRSQVLERLCAEHLGRRKLRILEIGAGAGNLATLLLARGLADSYVIVDLPEMLLNAAINLGRYAPDATIHYDEQPTPGVGRVDLVPSMGITRVDPGQFDVMVNFNSFMEMDRATRDMYIGEMYRTACDGAVLYNVNRRQEKLPQPDGSRFDNNPLLYPYTSNDHVLFWEDDPFETAVRAWFGKRPSVSIARAELVRKG